MWFRVSVSPAAPDLVLFAGADEKVYFRALNVSEYLGDKKIYEFLKRFGTKTVDDVTPPYLRNRWSGNKLLIPYDRFFEILTLLNAGEPEKLKRDFEEGYIEDDVKPFITPERKDCPKVKVGKGTTLLRHWIQRLVTKAKLYYQSLPSDERLSPVVVSIDLKDGTDNVSLCKPNVTDVRYKGQIQIIMGPMFSGKTTELMRRLKRYQIANQECLVIKYAKDSRYDAEAELTTHDMQKIEAVPTLILTDLRNRAANYSVIGIDEGQFFPDIVAFAETMANDGKVVIVAALDGNFRRKFFGNFLHLIPLAESVTKLTAVCVMCNEEASFTKLKKEMESKFETGNTNKYVEELIGGADKYMAVCRRCYVTEEAESCRMDGFHKSII
jgi:thymidine kinase